MSVSIETYDRRYLEGMTALYNAETAFEPHIAPLDPERFVALVESKSSFDPAGLLVAVEGGDVVGWAHACVAAGSEGHHDPANKVARLRMLIYPRDRLTVGAALVAEATAWLRRAGGREIEALHAKAGYPFYRGLWMGGEPMGPATMPHVQMALEVGGYKATQESIFMTAAITSPPKEVAAAVDVELVAAATEMRHEPMRESWIGFEPMRIQALAGGESVGHIAWVMLPHVADRLGAACMNIWGLGVRDSHRRKGIASALVASALAESYALGARFASVGTQLWNAPAHATYARFGFRPHCVLIGRTLGFDGPEGENSP
jgi:GNAT superfamily N-acetyltransferase